jgi:hypothetical protein
MFNDTTAVSNNDSVINNDSSSYTITCLKKQRIITCLTLFLRYICYDKELELLPYGVSNNHLDYFVCKRKASD